MISITYVIGASDRRRHFFRDAETIAICSFLPIQFAVRAARDLGANDFKVMALITAPMLMPSILAAFFLSVTFSWDEFIIAFLLSRFDVTLPVEIWSMLRSGLNPKTNAIGSLVFLVSVALLLMLEVGLFGRSRKS